MQCTRQEGLTSRIEINSIEASVMQAVLECIYSDSYEVPADAGDRPATFHTRVYLAGHYLQSGYVGAQAIMRLREIGYKVARPDFADAAGIAVASASQDTCKHLFDWFIEVAEDDTVYLDGDESFSPSLAAAGKIVPNLVEKAVELAHERIMALSAELQAEEVASCGQRAWRIKNVCYCRKCRKGYVADTSKVAGGLENAYCMICGSKNVLQSKEDAGATWLMRHDRDFEEA